MAVRSLTAQERGERTHTVRKLTEAEMQAAAPANPPVAIARIEQLPFEHAGELASIQFSVFDKSSVDGERHPASGRELIDPEMRCEISTSTGELIEPARERLGQGSYRLEFLPPLPGAYTLAIHLPHPGAEDLAPQRFHFWVSQ